MQCCDVSAAVRWARASPLEGLPVNCTPAGRRLAQCVPCPCSSTHTSFSLPPTPSPCGACSADSSSLMNDPLLDFVRKAMLSKQASPFASVSTQQEQQQAQQGQQQQQQLAPLAAANGGSGGLLPARSSGQQGAQQQQQAQHQQGSPGVSIAGSSRLGSSTSLSPRGSAGSIGVVDIRWVGGWLAGWVGAPNAVLLPGVHALPVGPLFPAVQGHLLRCLYCCRVWEIKFDDLILQKRIGEGSFGKVGRAEQQASAAGQGR